MRRLLIMLLLAGVAVGLLPGVAAAAPPPVGEKLWLYEHEGEALGCRMDEAPFPECNQVLDADTPFYVEHGWTFTTPAERRLVNFRLFLDGVELRGITTLGRAIDSDTGARYFKELTLFNFRWGLPAGGHTLTGVWEQYDVDTEDWLEYRSIVHVLFG